MVAESREIQRCFHGSDFRGKSGYSRILAGDVTPRGGLRRARPAVLGLEDRTLLSLVPTFTAVTVSQATVVHGQRLTLAADVTTSAARVASPTGTVTFTDGATRLGVARLSGGLATLTIAALGVGLQTITATYSGSATFAASTTGTINTVAGNGARATPATAARPPPPSSTAPTAWPSTGPATCSSPTPTTKRSARW